MRLYLSNEDLKGDYCDIHDCPIARALKRKFPDKKIRVTPGGVYINDRYYQLVKGNSTYIISLQNKRLGYVPCNRIQPFKKVSNTHRPTIVGL